MPKVCIAVDDNGNTYVFSDMYNLQVEVKHELSEMDNTDAVHEEVGSGLYPHLNYTEVGDTDESE